MAAVYLIWKKSWRFEVTLCWILIQSVTFPCCALDLCRYYRDYEADLDLEVVTTASHPRTAVFSSKPPQVAALPGSCFCQLGHKCAPQHSGFWILNLALGPLSKVRRPSQDGLHFHVLEPAHHPSDPWRSVTGRYSPVNPDKQLHMKTCYLWLKD